MCQMCEDYEAELRRLGVAMEREITVSLDDELMAAVRRRADANGRDVAAEIKAIVEEDLRARMSAPRLTGQEAVEAFRRIRAMTPVPQQKTDSLAMLREDRARDT